MKKIISSILIFIFMFTMTTGTAFAKQNNKDKGPKTLPYGIYKKVFDDADKFEWAEKAIEKLKTKDIVRGYNGKYFPQNNVTKIEAIVMLLRIMDLEDEALKEDSLPEDYDGKDVPDWAVGYVNVAFDEGILTEDALDTFDPQGTAKRYEVAEYVIRALGYEDEAEDAMDEELAFTDADDVPEDSVGYVYMVNKLGIMKGSNDYFYPLNTLTKAEMAVLFYNLDEKIDNSSDEKEYSGEIKSIDDDEIVLKINGSNKTFDVSEDVVVYEDDDKTSYSALEIGDKVEIQVEDNEITYIEINDTKNTTEDKLITKFTGELVKIESGSPMRLTVKINNMQIVFDVLSNAEVKFNGTKGSIDSLEVEDKITVTVDNKNRATKIYVYKDLEDEETVEGEIKAIDLTGTYKLTIDSKTYTLATDATVKINDAAKSLNDLKTGMDGEFTLVDSIITKIEIESETTIEGEITAIDLSGTYHLTIDTKTYVLDPDVEVEIDGDDEDLDDLKTGMEGKFTLVGSTITKADVESEISIEGEIKAIDLTGTYHLTIDNKTYVLDPDADVEIDGDDEDLDDLETGMEGEFTLVDSVIIKVDVED